MAHLGLFRDVLLNVHYNPHSASVDGSECPPRSLAMSMVGQRRLDNFAAIVAAAVEDSVPGHIIETCVWRGGASFMAAKTLELFGESVYGRRVYLADSFSGIPDQSSYLIPRFGGEDDAPKAIREYVTSHVETNKMDAIAHGLEILNQR